MQIEALIDVEALARYFQTRQNPDGGFCYYSLDESGLSDTCYAVLCLRAIGRNPENDRVADYLRSRQFANGGFHNIYAAWFTLAGLMALGEHVDRDPSEYILAMCKNHQVHEKGYIEAGSSFESTFYLADTLCMLGLKNECKALGKKLIPYIKEDGSIGAANPGLASTYFGLAVLQRAGIPCDNTEKTVAWVRELVLPGGGFSKKPLTRLAFMDETYYGLQIFRLLGAQPPFVDETARFVAGCQNDNGGFRRALASGISGFETSYYALESLKALINI
jgi:Uncharacterized protein conserved in archaea